VKGTVLVVDDSPTVRKIVTMTLEADGYEVVTAEDGVDATKVLVNFSPNLILLDINMPRMGGYKLCKLVKSHPDTSGIPVVMLSGKDGLFDKLRGKLVGCDEYISKPFESEELLKCVREHINVVTA
jgi:twitching motility two-component system response regulator PilG